MKPLLIYIELTEKMSFNFDNTTLNRIKEHFDKHLVLDIDNHSTSDTVAYITRAVEENDAILLILNALDENTQQPQALKLIQHLIKKPTTAYSIGKVSPLDKFLKIKAGLKSLTLDELIVKNS